MIEQSTPKCVYLGTEYMQCKCWNNNNNTIYLYSARINGIALKHCKCMYNCVLILDGVLKQSIQLSLQNAVNTDLSFARSCVER